MLTTCLATQRAEIMLDVTRRTAEAASQYGIEVIDVAVGHEGHPHRIERSGPRPELLQGLLDLCGSLVIARVAGEVVEVRCTYDPATRGGDAPDGRRVKGTLHWVSAEHAVDAEVRLYDRLFTDENPLDESLKGEFTERINPRSLEVIHDAKLEPNLATRSHGERVQFERLGYFVVNPDSTPEQPVWNRTVTLKDSWARIQKRGGK